MPKFNINKLRSAGLRYLVADADGQVWAYEAMPVRENRHWRLADEHICPSQRIASTENDRHYWNRMVRWRWEGREFCMPIYDVPFNIEWENEPYDIVEHELIAEGNIKIWPKFE